MARWSPWPDRGEFAPLHPAPGNALLTDANLNTSKPVRAHDAPRLQPQHHHLSHQAGESLRAGPRRGIRLDEGRHRQVVRVGPIRDAHGDIVASVGISSPVVRLHTKRMPDAAAEVRATARAISASFAD